MNYIKDRKVQFCLVLTFIISFSICLKLPAAQGRAELANSAIPRLEKVVQENIASFW